MNGDVAGWAEHIHVFKLVFCSVFGRAEAPCPAEGAGTAPRIRFLENISSSEVDRGRRPTAVAPGRGHPGHQGVVVHGLFHSLLLKAASRCRDEAAFQALLKEYREL